MKLSHKNNFINIAIAIVFILILISASMSLYNKETMQNALNTKEQTQIVLREMENANLNIRHMDISARGYALTRDSSFMFLTVHDAKRINVDNFRRLDSLFNLQGYKNYDNYEDLKKGFHTYANLYEKMCNHIRNNEMDAYHKLLKKDYGKTFWKRNQTFFYNLDTFEYTLSANAQASYNAALRRNSIIHILLIVISLPTLAWVVHTLAKESRDRKKLLLQLDENNGKYLFQSGGKTEKGEVEILDTFINNLKRASFFVNEISEGNYKVDWEELNDKNAHLNQNNLTGRLIQMRDQMSKVKQEDEKRLWSTEGLTKFSEIIRNHQHDLKELVNQSIRYLIKYMNAHQGSLFVLEGQSEGTPYLQLAACYALNRKKFIEKRIEIGEGMIGQTYLEGETVIMTNVPNNYINITSGLGEANPTCILIVPLKYNENVPALIELASFNVYEPHHINFLEKAGEFIASAIATAQSAEKTKLLLEQLQLSTEQLKSQEEEMRQNMEELEATQEEMRRKESILEQRIKELNLEHKA